MYKVSFTTADFGIMQSIVESAKSIFPLFDGADIYDIQEALAEDDPQKLLEIDYQQKDLVEFSDIFIKGKLAKRKVTIENMHFQLDITLDLEQWKTYSDYNMDDSKVLEDDTMFEVVFFIKCWTDLDNCEMFQHLKKIAK